MFTALGSNTDHGSGTRQRCRHDGPPAPVASAFAQPLRKRQTADLAYTPEPLLKAMNIRRGPASAAPPELLSKRCSLSCTKPPLDVHEE